MTKLLIGVFLEAFLISLLGCSEFPIFRDSIEDPVVEAALPYRVGPTREVAIADISILKNAIRTAIYEGNLVSGMAKSDVIQAWGKPYRVRVAGVLNSGNEEWIYTDKPPYQGELIPIKQVYFENGIVVGWRTDFNQ